MKKSPASNPLDPVVDTLRVAEPRAGAVERAVASLRRPHPPRLVPLAACVAALSLVALWPHGSAGLAWAQIAAQDLPVRYHEWRQARGRRGLETWVDRSLDAYRIGNPSVDGNRYRAERIEIVHSRRGTYRLVNGVATYSHRPSRSDFDPRSNASVRDRIDLDEVLKTPDWHQVGVERSASTRVGTADVYRLRRPTADGKTRAFTVYVAPGEKRVLGYDAEYMDGKGETTIEYPDRFPADTFAIPLKNGVEAYDLDAIDARLRAVLAKPIATIHKGGQTARLRLVAQGAGRELYVLWSGTKPNGDLKERVTVLNERNGTAFGLAIFTRKGGDRVTRLGGHAVQLSRRVDRVDLRIPVFAPGKARSRLLGYETVRGVAVERVPEIGAAFPALGLPHY